MTLIVETGAASSTSESYASVADANTYQGNRGETLWTGLLLVEQEQALRRATDYMMQMFRSQWKGYRVNSTQALDWPRDNIMLPDNSYPYAGISYYPNNSVPQEVVRACIELAFVAAQGDLNPPTEQQKKRTKVGPLEVEYADGSDPRVRYPHVYQMLWPFLSAGAGNNINLFRV